MAKLKDFGSAEGITHRLLFWCPGCKAPHPYDVPRWTWNGSMDAPTFTPSLLCNGHDPELRCHLFLTDGKIHYCGDCHHELNGQVVECPEWDKCPWAEDTEEEGCA